jgi:N-acylneuraminate cytidylyltransferase
MFFAEIHQVICVSIKLPRHRVQDIDTPEDWARAEWMFKAMQASKGNQ